MEILKLFKDQKENNLSETIVSFQLLRICECQWRKTTKSKNEILRPIFLGQQTASPKKQFIWTSENAEILSGQK